MQNKIDQVDWVGIFPSLKLVKCGREALQWKKIVLGFSAIGIAYMGWLGLQPFLKSGFSSQDVAVSYNVIGGLLVVPLALLGIVICMGQLSRLASMRVATNHSGTLQEVRSFVVSRGGSFLGGLFFLLFPLLVLGGLIWLIECFTAWHGVAILVGALFAVASVVIFPALLLFIPAITVDGNDGFDAPGRAVSYVLARPWSLGLHLIVLALFAVIFVGIPCAIAIGGMVFAGKFIDAYHGSTGFSIPNWSYAAVFLLLSSYAFSFLITGLTRIYFLIRESADGVPETELWQPSDDQKVTMGVEEDADAAR